MYRRILQAPTFELVKTLTELSIATLYGIVVRDYEKATGKEVADDVALQDTLQEKTYAIHGWLLKNR